MQCIMDVELNIMQKRSVSTKGKAEQSGGAAAQTVTLLRNTSNRDNAGISDYLPWGGAQKILSHFLLMLFRTLQTETDKAKTSFAKLLLGKDPR